MARCGVSAWRRLPQWRLAGSGNPIEPSPGSIARWAGCSSISASAAPWPRCTEGSEAIPAPLRHGYGKPLDGLNVAREQAAGLVDIARAQRLENQAVVLIGPWPPAGMARHREHQPGIGQLQSVDTGEWARHGAG